VNVEQFLYHEACLLDEQDPVQTSSIIYDDRTLLELRVKQARHPRAHSRLPLARTVHQVSNITVTDELTVHSNLVLVEYRQEKQRVWGALVEHRLRREGSSYRIAHKRVDLANSEGELDGIAILF
jgi:3-phenylpropionate/cinnamic acid dioxygenase small subunit